MIQIIATVSQSSQDGTSNTDLIGMLFQYGIPGLVIAALLLGLLWAKPAVDRLVTDKERAESQRDQLLRVYEEKMLPALADSIVVTRDLRPIMQDVATTLAQVKGELSKRQQ